MDKNAIKKYAVWARNELIARVTQKAEQYEITKDRITPADADSIGGRVLSDIEKKQRQALVSKINKDGFEQVMEEVAYTWFNRFTALRFMEVNNYLPSHTRVFTNEACEFKPQILADAIQLDLDGLDMERVYGLKDANKTEELYKYLLITQCNSLSSILPRMFQKIADYTELLLPDYLLREGSIIDRLIKDIAEEDFNVDSGTGQIEIVGWLYQYYNDEKKAAIIDMAGKTAIKKEDIPAATQLFTTDWVVRYIVDNSLGRYWVERNPNSSLKNELRYFIDQDTELIEESITPEMVTFFDPCVGSGHFALYAFSVLLKIYEERGYSDREAVSLILDKNIFGVDIDERAAQLAYFSLMMKARQHDRRLFSHPIQPHIIAISESNGVDPTIIETFAGSDALLKKEIVSIIDELKDAKNYGSLLKIGYHDFDKLSLRLDELESEISLFNNATLEVIRPIIETAKILSGKYTVVDTNPPYLNKYNDALKDFMTKYYKDYFGDLFSAFMYRNFGFCRDGGYLGFMTPFVWMFIKTYEQLRDYIINQKTISSLIQMEYSAFEEATVPICSFVLQNKQPSRVGQYIRLSEFKGGMEVQKEKTLEAIANWDECTYSYNVSQSRYKKIPGTPIAYWMPDGILRSFENGKVMEDIAEIVTGISTGKNDIYLRLWQEVDFNTVAIYKSSMDEINLSQTKWIPYNKGGEARKWYGNNEYIVKWSESEHFHRARPTFAHLYLKKGITWSFVTSGMFSARFYPDGFLWDVAGSPCVISDTDLMYYALGYLSTSIAGQILKIINPTINCQVIDIQRTPILIDKEMMPEVVRLSKEAVDISKKDWDSFEESWDFKKHPIIPMSYEKKEQENSQFATSRMEKFGLVSWHFDIWKQECEQRFNDLKRIEEELNRIFIGIFSMENEPTAIIQVDDSNVTVHRADLQRDIKSLISYAVGCMFGRYSIDVPGLVMAGGTIDDTRYTSFRPDKDAIIPICDDEYFEDDIVGRFVQFIEIVYGKDRLEENLHFIAQALGGKGPSREVIRNYFINDFYADHLKVYQKRPIYWLFDSGKKNGFKCLVYMHRYQPDTIARIRTDYVHEQQSRYRTAINDLEQRINGASTSERVKLNKQLSNLQAQSDEIRSYEERIHHLADQMIKIDLDDGVKNNYEIFKDVLAKIK